MDWGNTRPNRKHGHLPPFSLGLSPLKRNCGHLEGFGAADNPESLKVRVHIDNEEEKGSHGYLSWEDAIEEQAAMNLRNFEEVSLET